MSKLTRKIAVLKELLTELLRPLRQLVLKGLRLKIRFDLMDVTLDFIRYGSCQKCSHSAKITTHLNISFFYFR